ncbi:MAG: hypothetical protein R6V00_02535 [Candidatus Aminicenantes bacterium]
MRHFFGRYLGHLFYYQQLIPAKLEELNSSQAGRVNGRVNEELSGRVEDE